MFLCSARLLRNLNADVLIITRLWTRKAYDGRSRSIEMNKYLVTVFFAS